MENKIFISSKCAHLLNIYFQDKEEYVKERVKKLVEAGMISALMSLSKTESQNTREQVSR